MEIIKKLLTYLIDYQFKEEYEYRWWEIVGVPILAPLSYVAIHLVAIAVGHR